MSLSNNILTINSTASGGGGVNFSDGAPSDGDGDNARRRAHWLNHLFYSFDKWRPWFEDQTTEQLFKYWIENEHYDLGDSWSSAWRKRKHE